MGCAQGCPRDLEQGSRVCPRGGWPGAELREQGAWKSRRGAMLGEHMGDNGSSGCVLDFYPHVINS